MKKALIILVVVLPIGLVLWNFVFHPAAPVLMTAFIIWLMGILWIVIMSIDDLRARIKRQEEKTKELRALIRQKKF